MPSPNVSVVLAIFESYLSMRKNKWSLEDKDGKLQMPDVNANHYHKVDVCVKILQRISPYFVSSDDWIKLVPYIYEQEQLEELAHQQRWLPGRVFGSKVLLQTLQAVRSYIVDTLASDPVNVFYKEKIERLTAERKRCEDAHTRAINPEYNYKPEQIEKAKDDLRKIYKELQAFDISDLKKDQLDFKSFFINHILVEDPKAIELKEKSFDDFVDSVIKNVRKSTLCTKLTDQDALLVPAPSKTVVEPQKVTVPPPSLFTPPAVPAPEVKKPVEIAQPKPVKLETPSAYVAPQPVPAKPKVEEPVQPRRSERNKQKAAPPAASTAHRDNSHFSQQNNVRQRPKPKQGNVRFDISDDNNNNSDYVPKSYRNY
jgi:hypothetical protein